jgi:holo-[acyl-carrier protein] synthase
MIPPVPNVAAQHIRVGIDVVELAEVENSLSTFGQRYLSRLFTDAEVAACTGATRIHRLAARVAAKEAVIKAFALPEAAFVPREIEVVSSQSAPTVQLSGTAARLASEQGWIDVSLSISHADCHAAAVVVVVCAQTTTTAERADRRLT